MKTISIERPDQLTIYGRLFTPVPKHDYITVYRDIPKYHGLDINSERNVRVMRGDIIMFLGLGTYIGIRFLSRYGIIGWNTKNFADRNIPFTDKMILDDISEHFVEI